MIYQLIFKSNPHNWNDGNYTVLMSSTSKEKLEVILNKFPMYHYVWGKSSPNRIMEILEFEEDVVTNSLYYMANDVKVDLTDIIKE